MTRDLAPLTADSLRLWRALPLVPLDRGTLQTISDLSSDRRLVVRRGSDGRIANTRVIEIPLGFIGCDAEDGSVVAARAIGRAEVVLYRSRWITPSPSSREARHE